MKAILSSEWMKSMIVVHSIPDGLTAAEIEADPRVLEAAHSVGVTLEGLGYSVFARIVPLRVVADLVGGTVRLAWRKLSPYVEEERRRSGSRKSFEWFEWLARQLDRHSPGEPTWKEAPRTSTMTGSRNGITSRFAAPSSSFLSGRAVAG